MAINGNDGVTTRRANTDGRSMNELFRDLARDTQMLFSQEVRLAKLEVKEGLNNARTAMIFLGAAGVIGLVGLIMFAITLTALIALALPVWASALIVTGLFFAVAGMLALVGKKKLDSANPAPQATIQTLKEDQEWLKQQIS